MSITKTSLKFTIALIVFKILLSFVSSVFKEPLLETEYFYLIFRASSLIDVAIDAYLIYFLNLFVIQVMSYRRLNLVSYLVLGGIIYSFFSTLSSYLLDNTLYDTYFNKSVNIIIAIANLAYLYFLIVMPTNSYKKFINLFLLAKLITIVIVYISVIMMNASYIHYLTSMATNLPYIAIAYMYYIAIKGIDHHENDAWKNALDVNY